MCKTRRATVRVLLLLHNRTKRPGTTSDAGTGTVLELVNFANAIVLHMDIAVAACRPQGPSIYVAARSGRHRRATGYRDSRTSFLSPTKLPGPSLTLFPCPSSWHAGTLLCRALDAGGVAQFNREVGSKVLFQLMIA